MVFAIGVKKRSVHNRQVKLKLPIDGAILFIALNVQIMSSNSMEFFDWIR